MTYQESLAALPSIGHRIIRLIDAWRRRPRKPGSVDDLPDRLRSDIGLAPRHTSASWQDLLTRY